MERHLRHWALFSTLLILLPFAIQTRLAHAAGDVSFVDFQFSSTKIYEGDSGLYVDLNIVNDGDFSIKLHGASVRFDWQAANESFILGVSKGGEPFDLRRTIAPNTNYSFRIFFSVPTTAGAGPHFFEFNVFSDIEINSSSWSLDQTVPWFPNMPLSVSDFYEKAFNALEASVTDKIARADAAGFISPQARSLLQAAKDSTDIAVSYADSGEWQTAVGQLQYANSVVDQTHGAEQAFRTYLLIGVIIAIVAIIILVFFARRRVRTRRETKD